MMRRVLVLPLRFYQRFLSPLKPPCCRFAPTCSQYAIEAISKRGFLVGCALAAWRLLRCQPFGAPGFDPVPERRTRKGQTPIRHRRGGSSYTKISMSLGPVHTGRRSTWRKLARRWRSKRPDGSISSSSGSVSTT